eukprot:Nitzschia sp. Nitz4//scaffold21_size171442//115904//118824//NITZ4_002178-RA/size171442-augustus-gene-0.188-mRNA-1//1//CDS//3329542462//9054//frame0
MKISVLFVLLATATQVNAAGLRSLTAGKALVSPVVECTPEAPCGKCMGDCDTDSDCMDGLICYQKAGKPQTEAEAMVPGCNGLDWSKTDWCVEPYEETEAPASGTPLVLPVMSCSADEPCGECMGDCDSDADCMDGLYCYQKQGKAQNEMEATVPGCVGLDWSKTDWCVRHQGVPPAPAEMSFNRIASFLVCTQIDANCDDDTETVSEIIYASKDGMTLVYTDGTNEVLGFVDIADPHNPLPAGTVELGGEPTSTAVIGDYAVVCVNTSPSYTEPSGIMMVIDMATHEVLRTIDLGGQPDSVGVSPDENYIAIAIENERDEDLNDGIIPQLPAGWLIIIDTASDDVDEWSIRTVDLTGLDGVLFPSDPEPEYVDINTDNICVLTLQENNAIVLIDLPTGEVVNSFSAGSVTLVGIDIEENDLIEQTGTQTDRLREPDGVAWIGTRYIATADEGDYEGGSRTFTIFDKEGNVIYTSGTELDDIVTRIGHYPEGRSENKGNEPETVRYAEYGDMKILFVNSERASVVFVYDVADVHNPEFLQVLPAGVGPEGIYGIPSRNLVVAASEDDARDDKIRANIAIYELQEGSPVYPTLESTMMESGKYIPFAALSGLAAGNSMLYSVEDSFYMKSRIFTIDPSSYPYQIVDAMRIMDNNGVFAGVLAEQIEASIPGISETMINDDMTVNLDLEGIDVIEGGGFWVVSEGAGTMGDDSRPIESLNFLIRVSSSAVIEEVVVLPTEVNMIQVRFGFEGVAVDGDNIVVAFQRAWGDEDHPRIGIYNTASASWSFLFYPLDTRESQYGGWVGLSDLATLGEGKFLVLERDNQGGPDAAIKRIYTIDLGDFSMAEGTVLSKALVRDLMPDLAAGGGLIMEKIEGLAVDSDGNLWINNDNDGVDDNSGEQLLLNLGPMA